MPDLDAVLSSGKNTLRALIEEAVDAGPVDGDGKKSRTDGFQGSAASARPQQDVFQSLETYVAKSGQTAVRPSRRNAYLIMRNDKRLRGKVWLDEFKGTLMRGQDEYGDTDDTRLQMWLEGVYGIRMGTGTVSEVARLVGEEFGRNPLTSWLESLTWDGVPRMDEWLVNGVGAKSADLVRDIGRRWLIQSVARALRPGCKADTVLILVGPQGARKSTAFRVLAGDLYFCDTPMDIGSPNAYSQIRRAWIYEVAELDSIRKSANSATKAFLSAQEDTYRPAYGRHALTVKRHCVFCGTTNEQSFIRDDTGSRRFWPVKVGRVNLNWISDNREQLWAEAVVAYNAGEVWWLEERAESDLQEASDEYRQVDPWQKPLGDYCEGRSDVSVQDIMADCLSLERYQWTKFAQMRIGDVMRQLGYSRTRKTIMGQRTYVWNKRGLVISLDKEEDK